MTTLDELRDLRERLEKSEPLWPDVSLDEDLMLTLQPHLAEGGCSGLEVPRYTSSLDAAIALVNAKLPGWGRSTWVSAERAKVTVGEIGFDWGPHIHPEGCGEHKSEPIALLLALTAALEAQAQ